MGSCLWRHQFSASDIPIWKLPLGPSSQSKRRDKSFPSRKLNPYSGETWWSAPHHEVGLAVEDLTKNLLVKTKEMPANRIVSNGLRSS